MVVNGVRTPFFPCKIQFLLQLHRKVTKILPRTPCSENCACSGQFRIGIKFQDKIFITYMLYKTLHGNENLNYIYIKIPPLVLMI